MLLAAAAASLLVGVAGARAAAGETVDRGVVQSVSDGALALRRLDGTTVTVTVGPATTVRVNGRKASLAAIAPGFVAQAFHAGSAPARLVRAVGTVSLRTEEGTVVAAGLRLLTLRTAAGGTVAIALGPGTVVQRPNGRQAARRALRPGMTVRATYAPGRAAELVVILAR